VSGTHLKPLKPHFLLNIDCSSMYYYEGVRLNDKSSTMWSRVGKEQRLVRNKSSFWIDSKESEDTCMGVRVEFACGGSGSGNIFPIVIIFSSTIVTGMPQIRFFD